MKLDVTKFSPGKAEVMTMLKECKGLTIKGIEDKEGYKIVHQARMTLKNKRCEIKKVYKAGREEAQKYIKEIIGVEKDLISIIEPTERELEKKQRLIDEEKMIIARMEILPERKEKLKEINVTLDENEILKMNDLEFDKFFTEQKWLYLEEKERKQKEEQVKIEVEKQRLAEEKRIEEAKKQAEKEAKEQAIKDAELAVKKAEQSKINAIAEEQRKAREEARKVKREYRIKKITDLGLVFNGESFIKDDINIHHTEITVDTDNEFKEKINKITVEIKRRNDKQIEQVKQDAIKKEQEKAKTEKQAIIDEQKRKDQERIDAENEKKRLENERIAKEKEEADKLEKQKKYQKFLTDNGYTEETKDNFLIKKDDNQITLYKKVGEFIIN